MKNLGYSQNFLVNKKLVERLISKSNIDVTDYVIEIGPGKGIITDVLSQHAGEVVAVEYDQELYNNLVSSLSRNPVCTQEQTGSRTYMSEKIAKRNEDNRSLHFHVANFFKFMATNLSFTQFVT